VAIPGLERDGPGGSAASTTSAKEVANIDAVSGGRLTFGIALVAGRLTTGLRARPRNGVGLRLEDDSRVYREVWAGAPPGCVSRRARIRLTRQLPELFLCERAAGPSVTAITQSG